MYPKLVKGLLKHPFARSFETLAVFILTGREFRRLEYLPGKQE